MKCIFQEKTRKKTLTDGKGTLPQPKTGRFNRFSAQKSPFFSRFQVCPRTQNRKIHKISIQIRRIGLFGRKHCPSTPVFLVFSRHFRHSKLPNRHLFQKTELRNLQFRVKNARCGAMRAIFDPFSDPFPREKTDNIFRFHAKKADFLGQFGCRQPEIHISAPDGQFD